MVEPLAAPRIFFTAGHRHTMRKAEKPFGSQNRVITVDAFKTKTYMLVGIIIPKLITGHGIHG